MSAMTALNASIPGSELSAIVEDRADWLLDAVACATQDRRFLRGDPAYDAVAGEAILLNGAKAIRAAIAKARGEQS
jgi:hypothetical protein